MPRTVGCPGCRLCTLGFDSPRLLALLFFKNSRFSARRVEHPKCLAFQRGALPFAILFLQRVGYSSLRLVSADTVQPALIAVQPPILAIHCKVLNKLNKMYYTHVCLLKFILAFQRSHHLNPDPSIFLPTPTP
jgi:hypothetical protein